MERRDPPKIPGHILLSLITEIDEDRDFDKKDARQIIENLVRFYDPQRPCHYRLRCLLTGRCPFNPVCNN